MNTPPPDDPFNGYTVDVILVTVLGLALWKAWDLLSIAYHYITRT